MIEEGDKTIVVIQGTLVDKNVIMQNHGYKDAFSVTANIVTHKNSTAP